MAKSALGIKRRLTSKDIMGKDVRILWKEFLRTNPTGDMKLELYQIGGVVNRFETKDQGEYGPSTKLIGDFVGVNRITGEAFKSNRCYLPAVMSDDLTGQLASAGSGGIVKFLFNVDAIEDTESATGYVYVYENLLDAEDSDVMRDILQKMNIPAAKQETGGKGKGKK